MRWYRLTVRKYSAELWVMIQRRILIGYVTRQRESLKITWRRAVEKELGKIWSAIETKDQQMSRDYVAHYIPPCVIG